MREDGRRVRGEFLGADSRRQQDEEPLSEYVPLSPDALADMARPAAWIPEPGSQAAVIGTDGRGLARQVFDAEVVFNSATHIRAGGYDFRQEPVRPGVYQTWHGRMLLVGRDSAEASKARQQVELALNLQRVRQIGRGLAEIRLSATMVEELREFVNELHAISLRGVIREEGDCER